jgi:CheY-like chemotaxis protein
MLVVSSDGKDFQIIQAALIGESHFVSHTASGLRGVKLAQETLPDIIFISDRAEDLDGLSLCEYLSHNLHFHLCWFFFKMTTAPTRVAGYRRRR